MQEADWIKCVKNQGHRTCRPSKGTPSVCGVPLGALHKDSLAFPSVSSTSSVFAASSFWAVEGVRKLSSLKPETSSTIILRYSFHLTPSNWYEDLFNCTKKETSNIEHCGFNIENKCQFGK